MKKFFLYGAMGLTLAVTSCSNDIEAPSTAIGDGNVTIQLSLPGGLATRAFGEGTSATQLTYAIYDSETKELVTTADNVTFQNLQATVSVNLVNGKTYDFLFWAQDPNATCYAFDPESQEVSVSYDNADGNDDSRDAFFGSIKSVAIAGSRSLSATLKRPFAQINLGTDDMNTDAFKAAYPDVVTKLTTTTYSGFNLMDGEVTGDAAEVTFTSAGVPSATDGIFPVSGYDYVSMNYILAPTDKELINVSYDLLNGDTKVNSIALADVPVQRNYRTNIYGSVFTAVTDLKVVIDPVFDEPAHEYLIVSTTKGFIDAVQDGQDVMVEEGATIDLADASEEDRTLDKPVTIYVPASSQINIGANAPIIANTDLTIIGTPASTSTRATVEVSGGLLTNAGQGVNVPEGYSMNLINFYGGKLVIDNMTLVNDMDFHFHGNSAFHPFNSAAISYWAGSDITITNSKIFSGEFTVCGMDRVENTNSTLLFENSYFESNSSNIHNGKNWAYAMRLFGAEGTIRNCEVKGVQGGISPELMTLTIDGGKYYTVNTPGKNDSFYAVYASNNSTIIILDGEFSAESTRDGICEGTSCVVSGDNDINLPTGGIIIKGGKFSGLPYVHAVGDNPAKLIAPAEGYTFKPLTGQAPYLFEAVAE